MSRGQIYIGDSLKAAESQQKEIIFDAVEFIEFTWNYAGCDLPRI